MAELLANLIAPFHATLPEQIFDPTNPINSTLSILVGIITAFVTARWQTAQALVRLRQESAEKRRETLATTIEAYARPILLAAVDLQDRLWHLTQREATSKASVLLAHDTNHESNATWPMTRSHYLTSTLYVFARYFAWIQILYQEIQFLTYDLEPHPTSSHILGLEFEHLRSAFKHEGTNESMTRTHQFYHQIKVVERSLASTDIKSASTTHITADRPLFQFQQALIGQLLIKQGPTRSTCLTYAEFLEAFEKNFQHRAEFIALEQLLVRAVKDNPHDFCLARCCLCANEVLSLIDFLDAQSHDLGMTERTRVGVPNWAPSNAFTIQ